MRHGDKLASYRLLAAALTDLLDLPWSLDIVGDGSARAEVEAALAPLGARVTYHGAFDAAGVAAALAGADLFVWPAINEAFGMALLEAQASGLPVVAGASGGVGDIVVPGTTGLLAPPGDADAFAAAVRRLILDPAVRAAMGLARCHRDGAGRPDRVHRDRPLDAVDARREGFDAIRPDCEIDVFCGLWSGEATRGGPILWPDLLARLVELELPLSLEHY